MGRVNRKITVQAGLGVGLGKNTIGAAGGIKIGWWSRREISDFFRGEKLPI